MEKKLRLRNIVFIETPFLWCIKYMKILSKYKKNDYSEESTQVYILYHIAQFTTKPASTQNCLHYYYDKCICFANPSAHTHHTPYV